MTASIASRSSYKVRPWSPRVPIGTLRGATRCGPRPDAVPDEVRRGQTRWAFRVGGALTSPRVRECRTGGRTQREKGCSAARSPANGLREPFAGSPKPR
jgi:hypothetical protein